MGYKRLLHHPKASVQAGIGARKDWEASCPPIGRGAGRAAPITSADFAENRQTERETEIVNYCHYWAQGPAVRK